MTNNPLPDMIEALIFVSDDPITVEQLCQFTQTTADQVEEAIEALQTRLKTHSALQVAQVAGGFRLETKAEYYDLIRSMFYDQRKKRLSLASLETLALIAYKQPITAVEIAEQRMVTKVGSILKGLLERKLIRMAGRRKVVGRPMMYRTTKEFLIFFGLNSLSELPSLEEFKRNYSQEIEPSLFEQSDEPDPQSSEQGGKDND